MVKNKHHRFIRCTAVLLAVSLIFSLCGNLAASETSEVIFASSGYGYRQNFQAKTCADADNLITDSSCSNDNYWMNCISNDGYARISDERSYNGDKSLKVSGSGLYRKRISSFEADTEYYLSLWGMSDGDPVGDINFGFMNTEGFQLENPLTDDEKNYELFYITRKQYITIQCQDGSWYNRTYKFYTGSNTVLDFFITGTVGEMYLDGIRIFKVENAANVAAETPDLTVHSIAVSESACNDSDNLYPNGNFDCGEQFWHEFNGYGEFVEVVCSEGNNMLHYKSGGNNYYYLPAVTVEPNVRYTCSFWVKNLNGSGAKYGIAALNNPKGYLLPVQTVSIDYGVWKRAAVSFTAYTETQIALAIYDNGGEAVFDNIRLFMSENGYSVSESADMPLGGNVFQNSTLGSDGVENGSADNYFAIQLSYEESGGSLIDYSGYDWELLGENLITDPTVSCFTNGEYGTYYAPGTDNKTVINSNAWWDRPADYYNGHVVNPTVPYVSSAKSRGFVSADNSLSHTPDGSGAVSVYTKGATYCMPLPEMESNSYYTVTFWIDIDVNEWSFIHLNRTTGDENVILKTESVKFGTGWKRVTVLIYTGNKNFYSPFIDLKLSSYRIDDVSVYRLSNYNGAACFRSKRMAVLGDMNYDLVLNGSDLAILRKALINGGNLSVGDANNDNSVDIRDLVCIKKRVALSGRGEQ